MKRYIVSRIIGTGTEDDPYRPKIADQGIPFTASIPCDPVTGKPTKTHAFCIAASRDFQTILRDADNDGLPDVALDIKVSAIKRATVDAMLAAGGCATISLTGTPAVGDVLTLHTTIGGSGYPVSVTATSTDRNALGRALAQAVMAHPRLQASDGVELVQYSSGTSSTTIRLAPRNVDRMPAVGASYQRTGASTLKASLATLKGAQVSIYATGGSNLLGHAITMSLRPVGSMAVPVSVTVTGTAGESMTNLTNRLVVAAKAATTAAGAAITWASQAMSTGRLVSATSTSGKPVWEVRVQQSATSGTGLRWMSGVPDAAGYVRCEQVTPAWVAAGVPVAITTALPDGVIGMGRVWINPGRQEYTTVVRLDPAGLAAGTHTLRVATQDTSLEETWQMVTVPFTVPGGG